MKAHVLLLILAFGSYQCQDDSTCILKSKVENQPFPDLLNKSIIFYQVTVEYTLPNMKESIYYNEYYDIYEKKGRLDIQEEGESSKYYYYYATSEAFEIRDNECKVGNINNTPEFMRSAPYGWNIQEEDRVIHGPSAMFRHAFLAYKNNPGTVVYMGEAEDRVRGFTTKYWKRCLKEKLTAEYHFIGEEYDEAEGFLNLKQIPLRVYIYGTDSDLDASLLPQNYEFFNFLPMILEENAFELPVGYGCTENLETDEDVFPDMPDFSGKNLLIRGETLHTDQTKEPLTYASTFMLALDVSSDHMAYSFTPWKQSSDKNKGKVAEVPMMTVVDMKNKYVYQKDYALDKCQISNVESYPPRYYFPNNDGYIDLTDPAVFFPNNEFVYLGEGKERGLEVNIFEAVFDNFMAGEKIIPKLIATHYYLKPDTTLVGSSSVSEALIKVELRFYNVAGDQKTLTTTLTFNMFVFSTEIPRKQRYFNIRSCFKNNDESMWITVGYQAEPEQISKMRKLIPLVEENVLGSLETSTEISRVRCPYIYAEFTNDYLMVNILLLQRPPVQLDFGDVKNLTILDGSTEVEGIMSLDGCSSMCLESDAFCWGYAFCGATCYLGTSETANFKDNKDCAFYRRINNGSVPTMQRLSRDVENEVKTGLLRLVIPIDDDEPIDLEANYFEASSRTDSNPMFWIMGKERDPRFRVLKTAFKLKESDSVKNFGKLSYGECQRLCLDYKECETLSYCLASNNYQCVLTKMYGEEISKTEMINDVFCTILTRKYSDKFTRSPGNVLSQSAKKVLNVSTHEDCARACVRETSFKCLSFDHCPNSPAQSCRLHNVHFLDLKTKETSIKKDSVCGHYSRKFSSDFKLDENKKAVGANFVLSKEVSLEECAKRCVDYDSGKCSGFDYCQGSKFSETSCIAFTADPSNIKVTYSPICGHYTKESFLSTSESRFSTGTAGGLGFLFFIIGGIVGALIVFGIAYYRVNKST